MASVWAAPSPADFLTENSTLADRSSLIDTSVAARSLGVRQNVLPRPGTYVYHSSAANGLYLQARFRIFYVFTIPYNIIRELRDEGISLNDALEVANAATKHLQEYLTGLNNAPVQEVTTYIAEDAKT